MPNLTPVEMWLLTCAWCPRTVLVYAPPGVIPDRPPRGWFDQGNGVWVCAYHVHDIYGYGALPDGFEYDVRLDVMESAPDPADPQQEPEPREAHG